MVRIKNIIQQNFNFIETLGVLSVTRYVFEMLVWHRSISRDEQYGLSYKFQMMQKQIKYHQDFIEKAKAELPLLRSYHEAEMRNIEQIALKANAEEGERSAERWAAEIKFAQEELDRQARRKFSIYANQAQYNGYGFQAHLVETKAIPQLEDRLKRCIADHEEALRLVNGTPPVGDKWERQDVLWKWKEQARKCDMLDEYNFIYSFTSRLLHATPVSITTQHQLLEPDEMFLFLDYTYIGFLDMLDLADKFAGTAYDRDLH